MDSCKGDIDEAYNEFCRNLETFRKIVPVSNICMHGSPRSPYDNRDIWKKYNYRDLGIIGEPYFDIDFTKIAYYTDTGRMWDGNKYSVRDKVDHRPLTIDHGKNHGNTGNHLSSMAHGLLSTPLPRSSTQSKTVPSPPGP